jgi:protoporphyrinogen oxidase
VGGLSTSIEFAGGLVDLGPHVIGIDYPRVNELYESSMKEDNVRFRRRTTMLWNNQVIRYPPGPIEIAKKLGVIEAVLISCSYLRAKLAVVDSVGANYREVASGKFGRRLVDTCIGPYLEKLWGMPCDQISGAWEPGRVRNQSFVRMAVQAFLPKDDEMVSHPRLGTKQLYDNIATDLVERGMSLELNESVSRIEHSDGRLSRVWFERGGACEIGSDGDCQEVFSSLPLPKMLELLDPLPPEQILETARLLRFRNTIFVYVAIDDASGLEDHIRYINDDRYRVGRVTNFSIWTDGMAQVGPGITTLCGEIWSGFDGVWYQDDESIIELILSEFVELGIIESAECTESMVIRAPNTHPICTNESIEALKVVQGYLRGIQNLHIAGRAGSFLYADQDKVIDSSIELALDVLEGDKGR